MHCDVSAADYLSAMTQTWRVYEVPGMTLSGDLIAVKTRLCMFHLASVTI
jgi:hypothetical protein